MRRAKLYKENIGLSITKLDSVFGIDISDTGPEIESAILIGAAFRFVESLGGVVSNR